MKITKLSFAFTEEDMAILASIKAELAKSQGPVSNIVAIRAAIRRAICKA